jgi:hypothetical protein
MLSLCEALANVGAYEVECVVHLQHGQILTRNP